VNTVKDLRQALSEEMRRLQPPAGLETRVLQQALRSSAAVVPAHRAERRGTFRLFESKSNDTPSSMALVAALLAIAVVVSLVFAARALHSKSSIPSRIGPAPQAQASPLPTEICRAQCGVASQQALQPRPAAVRQCSAACATQAPLFTTPSIGWMTDSFAGPVGPAFLYRTDDGGQHWRSVLSWDGPGAQQIRSSPDGSEALVITAWGTQGTALFHTSDGGAEWTASGLPIGAASNSPIYFLNAHEGWVLSADLDLIHTTDGGVHWTRIARLESATPRPTNSDGQPGLGFLNSSFGWFVPIYRSPTQAPYLYLTHDGGGTWDSEALSRPGGLPVSTAVTNATVKFFDNQRGVIDAVYWNGHNSCGSSDPCSFEYVYVTSDGGGHWSAPARLPSGRTVFIDANHWFAMTGDIMAVRSLVHTADAGRHWSVLIAPPSPGGWLPDWDLLRPFDFVDPSHGWAIGTDGSLRVTSDGGMNWTLRTLPR
jgi:photosystem II stability/assembly factor-like uncharacterized protein